MTKYPMTVQGARALEEELAHLTKVVIDVTSIAHTGKVIFGTTVEIANVDTDESVTYQIVGEDEAEIKLGKISVGSPIARALIGKQEGDVVTVKTPSGTVEYEIVEVRHI